jgi:hypothetical protein
MDVRPSQKAEMRTSALSGKGVLGRSSAPLVADSDIAPLPDRPLDDRLDPGMSVTLDRPACCGGAGRDHSSRVIAVNGFSRRDVE